jgi:DNA-binding NarL/FixJ family response regulator
VPRGVEVTNDVDPTRGVAATRVVVVDDQTLVRQGIRTLLDMAGIEVVGEADDGQAAVDVIAATRPDVVLIDLRMPHRDGIWTLRQLRERGMLRLMAAGYSNREIAGLLFLVEGTVKNHVSAILLKLGARDRTNAVLRALHEGILR